MINPLTWLSRRRFPYDPLITVEVSKSALIHNLEQFRKIAPHHSVAPVLKSNAYGHGLFEVAEILQHDKRIPFLVVDSYYEAVALRAHGIKTPLLIIGYTRPETILASNLRNTMFTVTSLDTLLRLEQTLHPIAIHLKIDAGMHRQGILPEEIDQACNLLSENPLIVLRGLCSHLCDADNVDPSFTEGQIHVWNRIAKKFKSEFIELEYTHLSATDGHRFTADIAANVSRLGLGLYGLIDGTTYMPALDLKPAMQMKTILTGIKKLASDESVGYGVTFKAENDMTIGTIPVGYFEGVDRRLSNIGHVEVGPERISCQIIGQVSMNITVIDISGIEKPAIGMEVIVIGNDRTRSNSLEVMAKKCNTISYELAVHVPGHLKRVVVD